MEITQEYNIDCASQRMVIVKGEIGICLKEKVGQFSSLLLGTVHLCLHQAYSTITSKWSSCLEDCSVYSKDNSITFNKTSSFALLIICVSFFKNIEVDQGSNWCWFPLAILSWSLKLAPT